MSTFKNAKVIMLSTKQKATIGDLGLSKYVLNFAKNNDWINIYNPIKQHLYIISDDEIKEGDWYYSLQGNRILQSNKQDIDISTRTPEILIAFKKIIATTDKTLSQTSRTEIPQPSQQFIEKFVEEYNKGNIITDVLVEYNIYDDQCDGLSCGICNCNPTTEKLISELKINPKDNTITIKKVKDNWNKEEVDRLLDEQASKTTAEMLEKFKGYKSKDEVIDLIVRAVSESHDWSSENNNIHSIGLIEKRFLNKWIEENL